MELNLKDISFSRRKKTVLDSVTAVIPGTGLTCLLGTNGAGKTTILRILCGELKASSGTFYIDSLRADGLSQKDLSRYFSVIPQKAPAPSFLTVFEMVALGRFRPRRALWWRLNAHDYNIINAAMTVCQVERFRDRKVTELSGGEQQRVWLAFSMASDKNFLMLDETLDGMDIFTKREFFQLLKQIAQKGKGVVLATHDLNLVSEFADKVIVVNSGKVVFEGCGDGDLQNLLKSNG